MTFTKTNARGSRNNNSKLDDETVWAIRRERGDLVGRAPNGDPRSIYALAEKYGVKAQCIHRIIRGQRWRHHLEPKGKC